MNHSHLSLALGSLVLAATSSVHSAAQSSFQFRGDGYPIALSGTGQQAILLASSEYFFWDASGTQLPLTGPVVIHATALGISADGRTIVGGAQLVGAPSQAARWTPASGWQGLGATLVTPAGIVPTSGGVAADASHDGSMVVGSTSVNGQLRPFRWTAATGMVELEGGPGRALQVSDDGLTIGGELGSAIVRWNAGGQIIDTVPTAAGSFANLAPHASSAGGDHVVGYGGAVGGFVWNRQAGLAPVGDFNACCPVNSPGGSTGLILGGELGSISPSGHLAVGTWRWEPTQFSTASFATVWTPGGDVRRLDDELTARGANLGGFELSSAYLISSDAAVIAGSAFDPATGASGWFTARLDMEIGSAFCAGAFTNSTGSVGQLVAQGSTALGEHSLTLEATSLPPHAFAMAISSMVIDENIFGPGNQPKLCLSGGVGRHQTSIRNTGPSGTTSIPIDLTAMPQPSGTTIAAMVGQTWGFQVWHRDVTPSLMSNMTRGVSVVLH